jgi:hypothetical protein
MATDQLTFEVSEGGGFWVDEFNFLVASSAEGFSDFKADGILGLAKRNVYNYENIMFVEALYDHGLIDSKLFALELGHEDEASYIHFGSYD